MDNDIQDRSSSVLSSLEKGRRLRYVLQRHKARRAGEHLDLRLGDPSFGLLSWAVPKARMPEKAGESVLAVQTPLHPYRWGTFEGEIGQGAGAGTVSIEDSGPAEVLARKRGKLRFSVDGSAGQAEYVLNRRRGDKWFLTNVTPADRGRALTGMLDRATA